MRHLRRIQRATDLNRARSGASAVESAIVLAVLLPILLTMLDLGLATCQYNLLASAARRVAREASVRGNAAAPQLTPWGPAEYLGTAGDNSEMAVPAAQVIATMAPSDVGLQLTWPDGANDENDRVQVRLTYHHAAIIPVLAPITSRDLRAQCTSRIVH